MWPIRFLYSSSCSCHTHFLCSSFFLPFYPRCFPIFIYMLMLLCFFPRFEISSPFHKDFPGMLSLWLAHYLCLLMQNLIIIPYYYFYYNHALLLLFLLPPFLCFSLAPPFLFLSLSIPSLPSHFLFSIFCMCYVCILSFHSRILALLVHWQHAPGLRLLIIVMLVSMYIKHYSNMALTHI